MSDEFTCARCGEDWPRTDEFFPRRDSGMSSTCKACTNELQNAKRHPGIVRDVTKPSPEVARVLDALRGFVGVPSIIIQANRPQS